MQVVASRTAAAWQPAVFAPLPNLATSWHLLIVGGAKGGGSTLAFAGPADPKPAALCSSQWAPASLLQLGDSSADLGHIASLQMWSRHLSLAELRAIWLAGCAKHCLPPPADWVDWGASPAQGHVRVTGTAVDSATGAPLAGVRVAASETSIVESRDDGAFGLELPADAAAEGGTLVLALSRAGYAPQTVCVAAAEGETSMLPATRLLRLGAHAKLCGAEGGVLIDDATGATFSVPKAAFLNPDGSTFVGTAAVSAAAIDPSDSGALAAMPGDFSATTVGGQTVMLRSFGAFFFSAIDEATDGVLQLGTACGGVGIEWASTVEMDTQHKCAELPSAWQFDTHVGKWQQVLQPLQVEGTPLPPPGTEAFVDALKAEAAEAVGGDAAAVKFRKKGKPPPTTIAKKAVAMERQETTVAKFLAFFSKPKGIKLRITLAVNASWINCDAPYLACLLRGRLRGCAKRPGSWQSVRAVAVGVRYSSRSFASIGSQDEFAMMVQQSSEVYVEVEVDPQDVREREAESAAAAQAARLWTQAHPADCATTHVRLGPFFSSCIGDIKELGDLRLTAEE